VFVNVAEPVAQGVVASLARPGGNVTGFTNIEPAIGGKWLEILKEIAPRVARVALLSNVETAPYPALFLRSIESAGLAAKHRLPAIYQFRSFVTRGGLVSHGDDPNDLIRRSAAYVDRILRGQKPGDLPVQAPTKFELAINLKTAKSLGLTIPSSILLRADHVIE
jgi:putative ABC transport system substrate-binding protein